MSWDLLWLELDVGVELPMASTLMMTTTLIIATHTLESPRAPSDKTLLLLLLMEEVWVMLFLDTRIEHRPRSPRMPLPSVQLKAHHLVLLSEVTWSVTLDPLLTPLEHLPARAYWLAELPMVSKHRRDIPLKTLDLLPHP